jgi:putative ABC transport system permease protein
MLKSFQRLRNVSAGFDANNVLTMEVVLPRSKYVDAELEKVRSPLSSIKEMAFFDQLISRIKELPGVQQVGAITSLPLAGDNWGKQVTLLDRPQPTKLEQVPVIQYTCVAGDYFRAMGIQLMKGRLFSSTDNLNTPGVVVVNETFARVHYNGADPIGKTLVLSPPPSLLPKDSTPPGYVEPIFTIVGVVHDVRYGALNRDAAPLVYGWYPQGYDVSHDMYVTVRTHSDPLGYVAAVREQVWKIDRDQPVAEFATMEHLTSDSIAQPRLQALLLGGFGMLALVLASVGIYGLISYSVTQRTQEIGIRMALGASTKQVFEMVVAQGMKLTGIGLLVGLAAAFPLTRLMTKLLFGVKSTDPGVFVFISLLLVGIAALASFIPARRAMKIDPMTAMRYE